MPPDGLEQSEHDFLIRRRAEGNCFFENGRQKVAVVKRIHPPP